MTLMKEIKGIKLEDHQVNYGLDVKYQEERIN